MNTTKSLRSKNKRRLTLDDIQLFLLSLPTFAWYFAFCYLPMFGIIIAFKNYKLAPGHNFVYSLLVNSKWVGLKNFQFLFKLPDWPKVFSNTIVYNVIFIVLGILIPVLLALLISEMHSKRLAKVTQTAMFFPHFISWVVVSYFVYAFLATDRGLLNNLLASVGSDKIKWYQDQKYWPAILVFMNVWKGTGYSMVVYLAAISGIDQEMYEAALIDGATKFEQIRYITLPFLRPIISIMFILAMGRIFNSDFGLFYRVPRNSDSLSAVTQTIDVFVYKSLTAAGTNINYSSAAALFQSVLGCITIIISNLVVKRIDPESGLF
jgi:ABC-type polysaccharide transport system, permease component